MAVEADVRDGSAAVLRSGSEAALAELRRRAGHTVVEHRDRMWMEAPRGFYQPIHWLARLRADQVSAPRPVYWGFRAALRDEDVARHANGAIPVHLLTDIDDYGYDRLPQRRRQALRKCQKRATILQLTGPQLLREQGFEVKRSAVERTGYGTMESAEVYRAAVDQLFVPGPRLVLAGVVGGRLGGYLTGTAVDGTAYIDSTWIATEALSSRIAEGMIFEFTQACRRGGTVREIASGLHTPENRSLAEFKEQLGFAVRAVPARVRILPGLAPVLVRRYPAELYRLTGRRDQRRRFTVDRSASPAAASGGERETRR